jgi:uncharacterized protein (DUF1501 family)
MDRRNFLKYSLLASASGVGTLSGFGTGISHAQAACTVPAMPRTIVNVMLYGGADTRFIFMPAPNHVSPTNYVDLIWAARAGLYPNAYPDYATMFAAEYDLVVDPGGFQFGIHKSCGWLTDQFNQGNVAIIANSVCSQNRRHDQSQLNANVAEPEFGDLIYNRDGWGGRLVDYNVANGRPGQNAIELSHEISVFCNGATEGQRLEQVVHARDTRNIGLPTIEPGQNATGSTAIMTRALKSYYAGREQEIDSKPVGWPYRKFFQHNNALRAFGDIVDARLTDCGPLPASLSGLTLNSGHFRQQCRNLYDLTLLSDIFDQSVVSMRYDSWDTHNNQNDRITRNLSDLFGIAGGLSTATSEIANHGGGHLDNLAFCFSSDFGRQIRANGDFGTDHGRGLYSIVLSPSVAGGIYGEMFPERESSVIDGKIALETSGADILGQTSTERILQQLTEWQSAGSSPSVVVDAASSIEETPGILNGLLSPSV